VGNVTNLKVDVANLGDYSKELDQKIDTLNSTSQAEHEAISETILINVEDIQSLGESVDDINVRKSPIGTILAWTPKVQKNKLSIIELPLGN
jgi:hypothetical protein